jgi:hypothetical protein
MPGEHLSPLLWPFSVPGENGSDLVLGGMTLGAELNEETHIQRGIPRVESQELRVFRKSVANVGMQGTQRQSEPGT